MDTLRFLIGTSILMGAVLGGMSQFVFQLPMLASFGIAISSMIGLLLITLVLNSISYNRSHRFFQEDQ